jgi:cell division protein FtsA
MADPQLFAGIDIGSTAVRIAVGHRLPQGEKEQLHIIGAAEVSAEGINRGQINSIEDAVSSVSACVEKAERMTGTEIGSAWVSLSGAFVNMQQSHGVVAVSRTDGEIREEDVERAIEQAQTVATPINFEIIHVVPRSFRVDGQADVRDPVGMSGVRLEVDCQIIQGLSTHIKNLSKCIYRTGINLERLAVGTLAVAETVVASRQKELGVAVVNIGAATTTLAVFERGDILHIAALPIGSEHITSDIAIGLRTSIDVAEGVKVQHASASPGDTNRNEVINLAELGAQEDENVSRKYVCQIVEARAEELMEKIDKEFRACGRSGMLPAGVVFTGGGAKMTGLVELAKRKLRLPAQVGSPLGVSGITDRVNDAAFSTAIGLAQWAMNETPVHADRAGGRSRLGGLKPIAKVGSALRKVWPF